MESAAKALSLAIMRGDKLIDALIDALIGAKDALLDIVVVVRALTDSNRVSNVVNKESKDVITSNGPTLGESR